MINMVDRKTIDRINELARKQKAGELTAEEKEEQARLRREYIDAIKASTRAHLESIRYVEDMSEDELRRMKKN